MNIRLTGDQEVGDPLWKDLDSRPPEWTASMARAGAAGDDTAPQQVLERSRAAYALAKIAHHEVTVKVGLDVAWDTLGVDRLEVRARARDIQHGAVLGDLHEVLERDATRPGDQQPADDGDTIAHFTLDHSMEQVGWHEFRWIWAARLPGEDLPWHPLGDSLHRIYVVLDAPGPDEAMWPWLPEADSPLNPWTEVLDIACEMARCARGPDEAAAILLKGVYGHKKWDMTYDSVAGEARYTTWDKFRDQLNFHLSSWLKHLGGEPCHGDTVKDPCREVDCSDCACMLATLGNALGCGLVPQLHGRGLQQDGSDHEDQGRDGFGYLKLVRPMGSRCTNNPFHGNPGFSSTRMMNGNKLKDDNGPRSWFWAHCYCLLDDRVYDLSMTLPHKYIAGMETKDYHDSAVDTHTPGDEAISAKKKQADTGIWRSQIVVVS